MYLSHQNKICPFIFVMHSIFSYWEKSSEKSGLKNPEKMIPILDQLRLVIQTGISTITWTLRVSLRRHSLQNPGTNQPPNNNKNKQKALLLFLTASAGFKSWFERMKPTLNRIYTLACCNRVSSQHPTHSLQWSGKEISFSILVCISIPSSCGKPSSLIPMPYGKSNSQLKVKQLQLTDCRQTLKWEIPGFLHSPLHYLC